MKQQESVSKFIDCVVLDIQEMFGVPKRQAEKMVYDSSLITLIKKYPNQVTEYSIEHWAEEIYCDSKDHLIKGDF
ncbi:hypothetical protein [Halalkalibacter oceani]|uniref:hypothetical protein n=1 Tax=Halalkalibacter oceani TaxID=1653776 RepID=UPI00339A802B